MIRINELTKKYGDKIIFKKVSGLLENRNIYALVGTNGIGKTTMLNAITQPASVDEGTVEIDGIDSRLFQAKHNFFYVPDSKEMFLNLTGYEYLRFVTRLYHRRIEKMEEEVQGISTAFKLDHSLNECIGNYSLGMKQKVYLIAAFLSDTRNLILDEPFNGLDPESIVILKKLLIEYKAKGKLILFSSHNLDLVANFCDSIVFIDKERNIFLCKNPQDYIQLENIFFQKCV